MSYVAKSKEGERIYRKRPLLNVTVSHYVIELLNELEEISGWNRSRCVDEALMRVLPSMIKEMKGRAVRVSEKKEVGSSSLEEEYMKAVIFKRDNDYLWEARM